MNATKVGVLLVHGIGEQSQFEHLEGEVRNIATALQKAAAKTNRDYIQQAIQELANTTKDKHIELILNDIAKKCDRGNIKSVITQLVQKQQQEKLEGIPDQWIKAVEELKNINKLKRSERWELTELAAKKLAGKARTVRVMVNAFPSAAFGAKQESWHDGGKAPVIVEVYDYDYHTEKIIDITKFCFHQVWWADLDEPPTLWSEIRFWLWGLSLWTIPGKGSTNLPGTQTRMKLPEDYLEGKKLIWARISLFWVSLVILLILPVLSLLNFVLRRLLSLKIPPPDILSKYIGDVKLFQQETRIGKASLQDLGSPPRVTLRRRMVKGLVKMSLRNYDRWYILAHSQGTVLAYNGIMETAQSLPNYLTKELWGICKRKSLIRLAKEDEKLTPEEKQTMSPAFPSWREKEYILDRKELFKNCKGLLTYGSPLSKFAALWPVIVPLNEQDSNVFPLDFQWLNVYDPTDPVAGTTQAFHPDFQWLNIYNPTNPVAEKTQPFHYRKLINMFILSFLIQSRLYKLASILLIYKTAEPIDLAYKADGFHLLSHTKYLSLSKCEPCLVDVVARWLLYGNLNVNEDRVRVKNTNLTIQRNSCRWPKPRLTIFYCILRVLTWPVFALFIGSFLGVLISTAAQRLSSLQHIVRLAANIVPWPEVLLNSWITVIILDGTAYILLAFLIILITGTVVWLWEIITNFK